MRKIQDGFTTHQIEDINGEVRKALIHYNRERKHVSISVLDYESGTQIMGEAAALVLKFFKRCRTADLFLPGRTMPIRLPVAYPVG